MSLTMRLPDSNSRTARVGGPSLVPNWDTASPPRKYTLRLRI